MAGCRPNVVDLRKDGDRVTGGTLKYGIAGPNINLDAYRATTQTRMSTLCGNAFLRGEYRVTKEWEDFDKWEAEMTHYVEFECTGAEAKK